MAGTTVSTRQMETGGSNLETTKALNLAVNDLETLRAALEAGGVVAVTELMADHAIQKTLDDELIADHATQVTWNTEVDADADLMNNILDFQLEDGVIGGTFNIATTAATTLLGSGNIEYRLNGQKRYVALDTTILLEDSGDIVQNKFGAWRILIDAKGVVTTQDTGAQMAFDNAEDAMLGLSHEAPTANTVTIGYFNVTDSGGPGFDIQTTNTSGGTATGLVYVVRGPVKQVTGLSAGVGSALTFGSTPEEYAIGTIDPSVNGVQLTQIAAQASKAFDDADTIGENQFGGWLIVTNLAGTGTYALASNGIAGTVSAMTHATSAAADTAIDTLVDNLPAVFCPVGRLVITNNLAGTWTAATDDLNSTDGTATGTVTTVGTWDRTATGFDSHQLTPPTVPASIAATLVASLSAPSLTALSSPTPSATATDAAADITAFKVADLGGTVIA